MYTVRTVNFRTFKDFGTDGGNRRKDDHHVVSDILPDQRNGDKQHDQLCFIEPYLTKIRSADRSQKPVDDPVLVMIDHVPDQTKANCRNCAWKEAKGSMDPL